MADKDDATEKPFEATPRKLEEARKKGDIPISQDLNTASVYLGFLLGMAMFGPPALESVGSVLKSLIEAPDRIAAGWFGPNRALTGFLVFELGPPLAGWLGVMAAAALAGAVAQNALVVTTERVRPKLSRISPISTAKQKFGRDGLFNFAKSFAKLMVFSGLLAWVATRWAGAILATPLTTFQSGVTLAVKVCTAFLVTALLATLCIGGIDFLWQRAEHARKQRMSLKEMRDETKESEGDPHTKQARRQRGYDIATNRMLSDVRSADVVIVNPLHFAVALSWSRLPGSAPVCVAKGTDEIAARIREAANAHGVPIQRDPETARALHATVGIGDEIHPDHYRAVATAIRFADRIRRKARESWL